MFAHKSVPHLSSQCALARMVKTLSFHTCLIFQMLLAWINWKDEKATVARLAKALILHDQLEAIECLAP
jgi:hypothetical protein